MSLRSVPSSLQRASSAPGYQLVNRAIQSQHGLTQGGPIANVLGAPRWMGLSLRRFSSHSDLCFRLYFELTSLAKASDISRLLLLYPACFVHPTARFVRSPLYPVQSCSPRCLMLWYVPMSHTRYSLVSPLTPFNSSLFLCSSRISLFYSYFIHHYVIFEIIFFLLLN